MSTVKTDAIETRAGGTSVLTIGTATQTIKLPGGTPGADKVLTSNATGEASWAVSATPTSFPSVISQWNMTTTFTGSVDPIVNWAEGAVTGNGNYPATTGVTESSGVFTMASTGYWLILFQAYRSTGGNDQSVYNIRTSTSAGSGWSNRSEAACITYSGHDGSTQATFVLKCTDTSAIQVSFSVSAASGSNETRGGSGYSTGATFIKLADI